VNTIGINTQGQFFAALGLEFPLNFIAINGQELGDYIKFEAEFNFLVDFGNATSTIDSLISDVKHLNSGSGPAFLNTLLSSGAEITSVVNGTISIALNEITHGFLKDFDFDVAGANFLVTTGSGYSGMPTGFYAYFDSDIISGLVDAVSDYFSCYAAIFSTIGFTAPQIPATGISMGLFIQTQYLGITFTFPGFAMQCMFDYTNNVGSCEFGLSAFTALLQEATWVFQKAVAMFDKTGAQIVSIADDAANMGSNLASAVTTAANQAAAAAQSVGSALGNAAGTVSSGVNSGVQALKHIF